MECKKMVARFSDSLTRLSGSHWTVLFSLISIPVFIIIGTILGWSDLFLLIWNTFMSCIAYAVLFIVQNSQNKGDQAMHKKLDELIRAIDKADNKLISIEKEDI